MPQFRLTCAERDPVEPAVATVFWMHGLGAPWDFVGFPEELSLPADRPVRFIFPQAPHIPVSVNDGEIMPAWYDIAGLSRDSIQDEKGIRASSLGIADLIEREVARGMPASNIFLAGFSQGAAMALFTGLRYPERLAGIIALSGYLLLPNVLRAEATAANKGTPIFQAHGTHDTMVPCGMSRVGSEHLIAAGYALEWHEYPIAHTVSPQEVDHLSRWLAARLTAVPPAR